MLLTLLVSYLISIIHFSLNNRTSILFRVAMCPAEKLHLPVLMAARLAHVIQFWSIIRIQSHCLGFRKARWQRLTQLLWVLLPFLPSSIFLPKRFFESLAKRSPKTLAVKFCTCSGLLVTQEKNTLSCWIHYYLGFQLHVLNTIPNRYISYLILM